MHVECPCKDVSIKEEILEDIVSNIQICKMYLIFVQISTESIKISRNLNRKSVLKLQNIIQWIPYYLEEILHNNFKVFISPVEICNLLQNISLNTIKKYFVE